MAEQHRQSDIVDSAFKELRCHRSQKAPRPRQWSERSKPCKRLRRNHPRFRCWKGYEP